LNDVHGNLAALEAVLAESTGSASTWWCAEATSSEDRFRPRSCRCTEYDVDAAVSAIRESAQWVAQQHRTALLEPPDPDEATSFFESQRGA
jgi:hypothetical protein